MKRKRVDIQAILADENLRRELMVPTLQALQAREGIETTRDQAERAYYVVQEGEKAVFFDLVRAEVGRREERFVEALWNRQDAEGAKVGTGRVRFDVARRDFGTIEGSPLAYRRVGLVAHIFRQAPPLDPGFGAVKQGLATAADLRFVRHSWEVAPGHAGQATDWVPFAKGGGFSRFYSDVHLVVRWEHSGSAIRAFKGAYIRNERYYFKPGLTWPLRTQRGFNLRVMPAGCIFGHKGPAIFPVRERDTWFLLGLANSAPAEYLLKGLMSFGSWEVGVIKRLPVPQPTAQQRERIGNLALRIHNIKSSWDEGNEVSTRFRRPWLLLGDLGVLAVPQRLDHLAHHEATEEAHIQALYAQLNDEVYKLYNIPAATRATIEETLGERPPEILWPRMERKSPEQKRMEHVWRLLSHAVQRVVEADEDGIVPFAAVSGETSLLDRLHQELARLFPEQDINQLETEITNELKRKVRGYKSASSLGQWLDNHFFAFHASLYKKRPILWHIASRQGHTPFAFGALCQYHKFDADRMAKLRAGYLRDAIESFRREAARASQEDRAEDRTEWQARLEEAQALDRKLQAVQEGRHGGSEGDEDEAQDQELEHDQELDYRILTPWKSPEDRPQGWEPDLDDGVKVNIEPLQRAGVLRLKNVV